MNDFLIPANFEDSGKIMGLFSTRNVVEAVILVLPFAFCIFTSRSVVTYLEDYIVICFCNTHWRICTYGYKRLTAKYICSYMV